MVKTLFIASRRSRILQSFEGSHKLYRLLTEELKFGYVIRFRGGIHVTSGGKTQFAAQWVGRNGRATVLRRAYVTDENRYLVPTVVCVQKPGMQEAWCLAASSPDESAKNLIAYYGKRWRYVPIWCMSRLSARPESSGQLLIDER